MAHFAKVLDGIVTQVIVAEPEFFDTFVDTSPGMWVKTSYNMRGGVYIDRATNQPAADQSVVAGDEARERKNFAGIGFHYDGTGFYAPQPFDSWTLNSASYLWEPPIAKPTLTDAEAEAGSYYYWDEDAYQNDSADPKTAGWVLASS